MSIEMKPRQKGTSGRRSAEGRLKQTEPARSSAMRTNRRSTATSGPDTSFLLDANIKVAEGHPRLLISQRLGWEGVPIIWIACSTGEELPLKSPKLARSFKGPNKDVLRE